MSGLEELIESYCPEGVVYAAFENSCQYIRGITYNKAQEAKLDDQTAWKVLRANNITLSTNSLNYDDIRLVSRDVKVKEDQKLKQGDILICAGSGSVDHIGKVAYIFEDLEYVFGGFMAVVRCNKDLNSRYMFHVLTSRIFDKYLETALNSSTINNLNFSVMKGFRFPLPPIAVQQEIVRILDNFTNLVAELTAEQEARKKQYEYYRDEMLTFSGLMEVEYKELGDLGTFYGGLIGKSKSDFTNGDAKYITYMNVFSNLEVNFEIQDTVKLKEGERQNAVQYGDIIFTGSSETLDECGMASVITKTPNENIFLNSFCFGFRFNDSNLVFPGFSKHLFRSNNLRNQIIKTANGVTRYNVSKKRMEKVVIPLPSLQDQKRLAEILDNFDGLCNDPTYGLPAEIEARRKQYEFYRDKLLTFKEVIS